MVTAAGVLLLIGGAVSILRGILLLLGVGVAARRNVGTLYGAVALISFLVGAVELYAGAKVMQLKAAGRSLGVLLASLSALVNLLSLRRTAGASVVELAIDAFIVYALVTNARSFRP